MAGAQVLYEKDAQIVSYIINCAQNEEVWGFDVEDTFIQEYPYKREEVKILIREYEIEKTGEQKYTASFNYRDVHYQLTGIMEKGEMEEILNNLHFL